MINSKEVDENALRDQALSEAKQTIKTMVEVGKTTASETMKNQVFSPLPFSRTTVQQGNIGYLGSSKQSLKPILIIDKSHIVDPITDTNTRKFGVPVNRPTTADDITVEKMTFENNKITSQASTNYCEFSRIKLNGVYGDYNELINILQGGVYI